MFASACFETVLFLLILTLAKTEASHKKLLGVDGMDFSISGQGRTGISKDSGNVETGQNLKNYVSYLF